MGQPTPYNRAANFTDYAAEHTSQPYNAADHDTELNAVEQTLDGLCANIALIQRDDGHLRDAAVDTYNLTAAVLALIGSTGFVVRGAWLTATAYAVKDMVTNGTGTYVCATAHTSGVFATDKAAGKWITLFDSGAFVASSVSFTPTGQVTSGNVQAAIAEIAPAIAALKTFIQSTTLAAARTAIGLGAADSVAFAGLLLSNAGLAINLATDNNDAITQRVLKTAGTIKWSEYLSGNTWRLYSNTVSLDAMVASATASGDVILGIGSAPKTWSGVYRGIQAESVALTGSSATLDITSNAYAGAGGWRRIDGTHHTSLYEATLGKHIFYAAAAAAADQLISWNPVIQFGSNGGADQATYLYGTLDMTAGPNAGTIAFPATQTPSVRANTLDDYEEGTFTPTLKFGGGNTGITYALQAGTYTKIGNRCMADWRVSLSAKGSSTGSATVEGMPFTSANVTTQAHGACYWQNMFATLITLVSNNNPNATNLALFGMTAGATTLAILTDASFANNSQISGSNNIVTSA
jgi:hypothetical protein